MVASNTQRSDSASPRITQFELLPIPNTNLKKIVGYIARSTAPINVEGDEEKPSGESVLATCNPQTRDDRPTRHALRAIAQHLANSPNPELVISIHGYGTARKDAEQRYTQISAYADAICPDGNTVFIGYLWPSEKPTGEGKDSKTGEAKIKNNTFDKKIKFAFRALPIVPARILFISFFATFAIAGLLFFASTFEALLITLLSLSIFFFATIFSLVLLRLSAYFRDSYRATNFGIPDLVEIIRHLDQEISRVYAATQEQEALTNTTGTRAESNQPRNRVKLSFIGHSMGCFVVTNTIRILSDVFDNDSIDKKPDSNIGNIFELARLVLVAPDIPVETIMPRRANFLRSALRRCEEAYVFTNEADLALRLASTAANYFSFPAKERYSGHRLGNLNVARPIPQPEQLQQNSNYPAKRELRKFRRRKLETKDYGIVNLGDTQNNRKFCRSPYECLQIRSSDGNHKSLSSVRRIESIEKENLDGIRNTPVANLFTYFDCTDYVDQADADATKLFVANVKPRGIVSNAKRKSALKGLDYIQVGLAYFLMFPSPINTHGGYFDGLLSQKLIYNLAFRGFQENLQLLAQADTPQQEQSFSDHLTIAEKYELLDNFSRICQQKGIQVVLSPVRLRQDILGEDVL